MQGIPGTMPSLQIKRLRHDPTLMTTVSEIPLNWQDPVIESNCPGDAVGGGEATNPLACQGRGTLRSPALVYLSQWLNRMSVHLLSCVAHQNAQASSISSPKSSQRSTCVYVCICKYTDTRKYIYMYLYTYICIFIYLCTYADIYTQTYISI